MRSPRIRKTEIIKKNVVEVICNTLYFKPGNKQVHFHYCGRRNVPELIRMGREFGDFEGKEVRSGVIGCSLNRPLTY